VDDEQVLSLSDIFPTGYMAADFCELNGAEFIEAVMKPLQSLKED
jgi:hypothetical protein